MGCKGFRLVITPVLVEHIIAPCKALALPVCRADRIRFLQPRSGEAHGLPEHSIAPHFEQAQTVLHAVGLEAAVGHG